MKKMYLDFKNSKLDDSMFWYNEPKDWGFRNGTLEIKPEKKTDFWQKTHYDYQYDNGHCLFTKVKGEFSIETKIHYQSKHQADQSGLIVYLNENFWVKTCMELETLEFSRLSASVTNHGYSDWSMEELPNTVTTMSYRISRERNNYLVEVKWDDMDWRWFRVTCLQTEHDEVKCGVFAASPIESGYVCNVEYLKIDENKWSRPNSQ